MKTSNLARRVNLLVLFTAGIFSVMPVQADPQSNADIPITAAPGQAQRDACKMVVVSRALPKSKTLVAFRKTGFLNPDLYTLDANTFCTVPKALPRSFQFGVVVFRDARWSETEVVNRLRRTAEIYAQCGVALSSATVLVADSFKGNLDIESQATANPSAKLAIAQAARALPHPTLFYIRDISGGGNGHAFPEFSVAPESPLQNTAWLSSNVLSRKYQYMRDASYSPDAHELGHVLVNSGHDQSGKMNFLAADFGLVNDQITPEQCSAIVSHRLVK